MAVIEKEVNQRISSAPSPTDILTFITTEGEQIVFEDMDTPVEEAAVLMGEEALGRIWSRPAEDDAWRGI